ncbi:hypothetical protein KC19_6G100500 [Ceratodon purpureus]|uniref:non-specific serine/threonine protein kinase n=2 Tax=Ceratodon purpureus TaxID=3225 RepID=A0A8T0HHA3_CERPU|nr:hypothetical protein KC19_6G100500 [Ceratodon purpureus]KAG0569579.1 hypothetical protein KC19_6G100500 [Ceratodon purpureus]
MAGAPVKQRVFRGGRVLVLALFYLSALSNHVDAAVNPTDVGVLNSLSAAWGANTMNWGTGDPCTWTGVFCDPTGTKVMNLLLQATNIAGTIPAAIGSFTGLEQLDLSYNPGLGGPIPPQIGQLTTLTSLIIQNCALTGPVPPEIGNLKNLTFIGLNNNYLSGSIPSSIGSLQQLYWFDLSTNNLTGELPVSTKTTDGYGLDTMTGCKHFHFNNNSLTGPLPSEFGAPPDGIPKLTKLIHMLLENNQLSGSIPDSIANLTSLEILSLSNNKFTGIIPPGLSRLATGPLGSTLEQILVGGNQLTGTIPNFTALNPKLAVVEFSKNLFDPQPFPEWLKSAPTLQTVYMEYVGLIGPLPADVLAYPSLETLWVRNNSLNGTVIIPPVIGPKLLTLSLQNNEFVGFTQTNTSTNMSQIDIELAGNPACDANNVGRPTQLCDQPSGSKLPWSSPFVSNCPSVTCSDSLVLNPLKTGNCNCTLPLEMQLEARRPTFSVITDSLIETLRLKLVAQLNLQNSQVWISTAAFSADGRAEINVDFFSADGVSDLDRASTSNITHSLTSNSLVLDEIKPYLARVIVSGETFFATSKKRLGTGAIVGIVLGVLAALAAVGIYAFWQRRRAERLKHISKPFAKWGKGEGESALDAPQISGARFFPYSEVKRITNNFSENNEIGVGGYGKVYSGVLDNGNKVAVKRAAKDSMQGAEEFKNEIELLSRVHHKNLVGLVGYCYDQGEQMLVYEFMPNGTMSEWLRGKMAYPLDWSKRLSIAVGSARGLAYLHELADPPIIHRDIKSQNILLDDKHVAKVADFGLSKQAPDGLQIQTAQVKGTLGYLDPEYYMTNELSDKSDVYSFGVVLLELLTSKAPIQNGKYIVREVRTAYQEGGLEGVESILDPSVFEASQEDLRRFLDLALSCVEELGADRPSMNEVVRELETLANRNKPKAKASAQATDETWLTDVYGDEDYDDAGQGTSSNFKYSGGYKMPAPEPK